MSSKSKDEKLEIARELAVVLAPYLWERSWGFGLNLYFDDVHVDYREIHSYIFSADDSEDESKVREHFDEACVEYGASDTQAYHTYQEIIALDSGIEMFIACEQEIYEEIYLYLWQGLPGGKGMVDSITEVLERHGMVWDLQGESIEIYSDDPSEE